MVNQPRYRIQRIYINLIAGRSMIQFCKKDGGVYVFGRGAGHDEIDAFDDSANNHNTIQLLDGIAPADILLQRVNGDLLLMIKGANDSIDIWNFFAAINCYGEAMCPGRVEQIRFADGSVWNAREIMMRAGQGGSPLRNLADADNFSGAMANSVVPPWCTFNVDSGHQHFCRAWPSQGMADCARRALYA